MVVADLGQAEVKNAGGPPALPGPPACICGNGPIGPENAGGPPAVPGGRRYGI